MMRKSDSDSSTLWNGIQSVHIATCAADVRDSGGLLGTPRKVNHIDRQNHRVSKCDSAFHRDIRHSLLLSSQIETGTFCDVSKHSAIVVTGILRKRQRRVSLEDESGGSSRGSTVLPTALW